MEQFPAKRTAKRNLFMHYEVAFEKLSVLKLVVEPSQCQSNYWLLKLLPGACNAVQSDAILKVKNDASFMMRPTMKLLDEQS